MQESRRSSASSHTPDTKAEGDNDVPPGIEGPSFGQRAMGAVKTAAYYTGVLLLSLLLLVLLLLGGGYVSFLQAGMLCRSVCLQYSGN